MQKARRHTVVLRPLVSVWFQVLFTLLLAVLFTFPSRYLFAIGLSGVFSLTGWYRQIHTKFLWFRATQDPSSYTNLTSTGLSPCSVKLPSLFPFNLYTITWSFYPISIAQYGLGSSAFARHYLRNHFLIFSSCGYLDVSVPHVLPPYGVTGLQPAGLPHSDICDYNGYLHLIAAFRSLSRPSSPLRA